MTVTVTIDPRFCGPPGIGNGGYVCGLLASALAATPDAAVEVTLKRGAPLGKPLSLGRIGGVVRLRDGDLLLAEARIGQLALVMPPVPGPAAVAAAGGAYPGHGWHPFPECFGCGPARAAGDGLRVMPGPIAPADGALPPGAATPGAMTPGMLATPWVPEPGFADPDGVVRGPFIWSALDCAGGWAVMGGERRLVLLGRLTARLIRPVKAGEACTVLAWPLGTSGRKRDAGTALLGADGALAGLARATWVDVTDMAQSKATEADAAGSAP